MLETGIEIQYYQQHIPDLLNSIQIKANNEYYELTFEFDKQNKLIFIKELIDLPKLSSFNIRLFFSKKFEFLYTFHLTKNGFNILKIDNQSSGFYGMILNFFKKYDYSFIVIYFWFVSAFLFICSLASYVYTVKKNLANKQIVNLIKRTKVDDTSLNSEVVDDSFGLKCRSMDEINISSEDSKEIYN